MTEDARTPDGGPDPSDLPEGPDLAHAEEHSGEPSPSQPLVSWPPPGLERLQGDLWAVVDRLGMGGVIFAVPLLAGLTLSTDPWQTGIYGDAWWMILITSAVGLWILLAGYVSLFRVLRRWKAAMDRGYAVRTVALVMADRPGDTGFLVQGGRAYSVMDATTRGHLLTGRLFQAWLLVGGGVWLTAGFVLGVALSARGVLGEADLAVWTVWPLGAAAAATIVLRAWENGVLRKARKAWFTQEWQEDLTREEIDEWHQAVGVRTGAVPVPVGKPGGGRRASLAAAAGLTALAGVLVPLLAVPLVVTSSVGPVLTQLAMPRFVRTVERAARTEALIPLRLEVDPAITPLEAGEALYALSARSPEPRAESMKAPVRYHEDIFPGNEYSENPTGMAVHSWARDLMPMVADGLDPAALAYLEEKAQHPALAEIGVLARAGALDGMGAVYRLPLPDDMTAHGIPIPRYSAVRSAAYAHVGGAAADAVRGRLDAAETRLREVISAGTLMSTQGQTLIAALIGTVVASVGAEGLANFWEATGRADEADALRARVAAAERAIEVGTASLGGRELEEMPAVVTDTTAIRGMRWEHLYMLTGLGPCLNMNRVVFGPPEDMDAWLAQVRETLVRYESEEAIMEVMLRGWQPPEAPGLFTRLLTTVMDDGVGSCVSMLEAAM